MRSGVRPSLGLMWRSRSSADDPSCAGDAAGNKICVTNFCTSHIPAGVVIHLSILGVTREAGACSNNFGIRNSYCTCDNECIPSPTSTGLPSGLIRVFICRSRVFCRDSNRHDGDDRHADANTPNNPNDGSATRIKHPHRNNANGWRPAVMTSPRILRGGSHWLIKQIGLPFCAAKPLFRVSRSTTALQWLDHPVTSTAKQETRAQQLVNLLLATWVSVICFWAWTLSARCRRSTPPR